MLAHQQRNLGRQTMSAHASGSTRTEAPSPRRDRSTRRRGGRELAIDVGFVQDETLAACLHPLKAAKHRKDREWRSSSSRASP
jgi:hypothetical protein